MIFNIPSEVQYIINKFYKNNYEAYVVGGSIRDVLLNKSPKDYDIATSAPPEVTLNLFEKTFPTGIKHGTITIVINGENYEVTTFRTEGEYINNRSPQWVKFVTSLKEDLARRDFTINSLAYNKKTGLIDYFNGQEDLQNKLIRAVGDSDLRFKEDALRMLRGIRFSAQLDFDIEDNTLKSIYRNKELITNISKERIRDELLKTLISNNPIKGLNLFNTIGILKLIFNTDLKLNLDNNILKLPKDISLRLAFIFINYPKDIVEILKYLKLSNVEINLTSIYLNNIELLRNSPTKLELKKLISKAGKDNIFNLVNLVEILYNISLKKELQIINTIIDNEEPLFLRDLAINGKIIKETLPSITGKGIGEILNILLDLVVREKIENKKEVLVEEIKKRI